MIRLEGQKLKIKQLKNKIVSLVKRKKTLGLALGGGAARGIAHVGVFKVLIENGIPVDMIAGTSSGALFGALFAGGLPLKEMERATRRAGWHRLVRIALSRRGAVSGESMVRLVEDSIGKKDFKDLKIPFVAVASDLRTGRKVVIDRGGVGQAVHASSAIPGVFVPVHINGKLLSDGMVVDNVPADVVRKMGADVVIAVDVLPKIVLSSDPENMVEVVERSLDVGVKLASKRILEQADFVIEPVEKNIRPFSLNHADELIEMGRAAAAPLVGAIRRKLLSFHL